MDIIPNKMIINNLYNEEFWYKTVDIALMNILIQVLKLILVNVIMIDYNN